MDNLNRPSILEANLLYLLLGILFFFFGPIVQGREIYSGIIITEYIIILLPNLLYLKLKGLSLRKQLRLNKISLKQIGYIILITIFAYPIAIFFNAIIIWIVSLFSDAMPSIPPLPDNKKLYFISLFIMAITPGICEEVMFRGNIMNAYRVLGKKKAIIYSAILFGVFHMNLQNLSGPIVLGIILGIVVYKTNSLFASILAHSVSNGIAITLGYFASKYIGNIGDVDNVQLVETSYTLQLFISLLFLSTMAFAAFLILKRLIKDLPESERTEEADPGLYMVEKTDYIPIIGVVILFFIVNIKYLFL